jgi:hypothetical protein
MIGGWIEGYNDNHPHPGQKIRSPREFIADQTAFIDYASLQSDRNQDTLIHYW